MVTQQNKYSFESPKHKVFISFHHRDDTYRRQFEREFSGQVDGFISHSVQDGDINPRNKTEIIRRIVRNRFISDSTVTVVLIGAETWRRKHVDWEIGYSLTKTSRHHRSGLLGILLPNYSIDINCHKSSVTEDGILYTPCNIPPRLYDNVLSGYAKIYGYPRSIQHIRCWIHEAYKARRSMTPDNNRYYFKRNKSYNYNIQNI